MRVENPHTVSLRFPGPGSSSQGKSGPKSRPNRRRRWQTGLKFLYRLWCDGMTREAVEILLLDGGLSAKMGNSGKSGFLFQTLKRDGELRTSVQRELSDARPPRKVSKLQP